MQVSDDTTSVSMILSPLMKRLGDHAADMIVIRDGSTKELDACGIGRLDGFAHK